MAKCCECAKLDWNNKKTSSYDLRYCPEVGEYRGFNDSSCRYFVKKEKADTGCFITTVVVDILGYSDDCWILNTLRNFRNNILQKDYKYGDILLSYDVIGPKIASALKNKEGKEEISILVAQRYLIPICRLINMEDYTSATNLYIGMVRFLQNQLFMFSDSNKYEYDDSVKAEEKGHGRALVKLATNE